LLITNFRFENEKNEIVTDVALIDDVHVAVWRVFENFRQRRENGKAPSQVRRSARRAGRPCAR